MPDSKQIFKIQTRFFIEFAETPQDKKEKQLKPPYTHNNPKKKLIKNGPLAIYHFLKSSVRLLLFQPKLLMTIGNEQISKLINILIAAPCTALLLLLLEPLQIPRQLIRVVVVVVVVVRLSGMTMIMNIQRRRSVPTGIIVNMGIGMR